MAAAIDAGPAVDDTADTTPGAADDATSTGRAAAAAATEAIDLGGTPTGFEVADDDGRGFLTGSPPPIIQWNLTTRGLLLGAGLFVFGRLYVGSDGSCERLLLVSEILITKNDEGNSLRCGGRSGG